MLVPWPNSLCLELEWDLNVSYFSMDVDVPSLINVMVMLSVQCKECKQIARLP